MNYYIKNYCASDFEMVKSWWKAANEVAPLEDMLPEDSTFIVKSLAGEPIAVVTMYLMNSTRFALVDNLVGNPEYSGKDRSQAIQYLQDFLEKFAISKGYKSLFCMSMKPTLTKYYQRLGYNITVEGITTMTKQLGVN